MRMFVIALLLGVSPITATAQKPYKAGNAGHSHRVGKGTPASLARHKDNSDIMLRGNTKTGHASELTKIEQQSMHSSSTPASKSAHGKSSALPKMSVAQGERNAPINFDGKASSHRATTITVPKSSGKSRGLVQKPH